MARIQPKPFVPNIASRFQRIVLDAIADAVAEVHAGKNRAQQTKIASRLYEEMSIEDAIAIYEDVVDPLDFARGVCGARD
jgi:hypothetical protein